MICWRSAYLPEEYLDVESVFWEGVSSGVFILHEYNLREVVELRHFFDVLQCILPLRVFQALHMDNSKRW